MHLAQFVLLPRAPVTISGTWDGVQEEARSADGISLFFLEGVRRPNREEAGQPVALVGRLSPSRFLSEGVYPVLMDVEAWSVAACPRE
jgi:hypothetical protein